MMLCLILLVSGLGLTHSWTQVHSPSCKGTMYLGHPPDEWSVLKHSCDVASGNILKKCRPEWKESLGLYWVHCSDEDPVVIRSAKTPNGMLRMCVKCDPGNKYAGHQVNPNPSHIRLPQLETTPPPYKPESKFDNDAEIDFENYILDSSNGSVATDLMSNGGFGISATCGDWERHFTNMGSGDGVADSRVILVSDLEVYSSAFKKCINWTLERESECINGFGWHYAIITRPESMKGMRMSISTARWAKLLNLDDPCENYEADPYQEYFFKAAPNSVWVPRPSCPKDKLCTEVPTMFVNRAKSNMVSYLDYPEGKKKRLMRRDAPMGELVAKREECDIEVSTRGFTIIVDLRAPLGKGVIQYAGIPQTYRFVKSTRVIREYRPDADPNIHVECNGQLKTFSIGMSLEEYCDARYSSYTRYTTWVWCLYSGALIRISIAIASFWILKRLGREIGVTVGLVLGFCSAPATVFWARWLCTSCKRFYVKASMHECNYKICVYCLKKLPQTNTGDKPSVRAIKAYEDHGCEGRLSESQWYLVAVNIARITGAVIVMISMRATKVLLVYLLVWLLLLSKSGAEALSAEEFEVAEQSDLNTEIAKWWMEIIIGLACLATLSYVGFATKLYLAFRRKSSKRDERYKAKMQLYDLKPAEVCMMEEELYPMNIEEQDEKEGRMINMIDQMVELQAKKVNCILNAKSALKNYEDYKRSLGRPRSSSLPGPPSSDLLPKQPCTSSTRPKKTGKKNAGSKIYSALKAGARLISIISIITAVNSEDSVKDDDHLYKPLLKLKLEDTTFHEDYLLGKYTSVTDAMEIEAKTACGSGTCKATMVASKEFKASMGMLYRLKGTAKLETDDQEFADREYDVVLKVMSVGQHCHYKKVYDAPTVAHHAFQQEYCTGTVDACFKALDGLAGRDAVPDNAFKIGGHPGCKGVCFAHGGSSCLYGWCVSTGNQVQVMELVKSEPYLKLCISVAGTGECHITTKSSQVGKVKVLDYSGSSGSCPKMMACKDGRCKKGAINDRGEFSKSKFGAAQEYSDKKLVFVEDFVGENYCATFYFRLYDMKRACADTYHLFDNLEPYAKIDPSASTYEVYHEESGTSTWAIKIDLPTLTYSQSVDKKTLKKVEFAGCNGCHSCAEGAICTFNIMTNKDMLCHIEANFTTDFDELNVVYHDTIYKLPMYSNKNVTYARIKICDQTVDFVAHLNVPPNKPHAVDRRVLPTTILTGECTNILCINFQYMAFWDWIKIGGIILAVLTIIALITWLAPVLTPVLRGVRNLAALLGLGFVKITNVAVEKVEARANKGGYKRLAGHPDNGDLDASAGSFLLSRSRKSLKAY